MRGSIAQDNKGSASRFLMAAMRSLWTSPSSARASISVSSPRGPRRRRPTSSSSVPSLPCRLAAAAKWGSVCVQGVQVKLVFVARHNTKGVGKCYLTGWMLLQCVYVGSQ